MLGDNRFPQIAAAADGQAARATTLVKDVLQIRHSQLGSHPLQILEAASIVVRSTPSTALASEPPMA